MYNAAAFNDYIGRLEDYLEYVNTDVDSLMAWEPELYAAYGTHNNKKIEEIKDWYEDAEDMFISFYDPELYIASKYGSYLTDEDLWDLVDREVGAGTIYDCGGYWFRTE